MNNSFMIFTDDKGLFNEEWPSSSTASELGMSLNSIDHQLMIQCYAFWKLLASK